MKRGSSVITEAFQGAGVWLVRRMGMEHHAGQWSAKRQPSSFAARRTAVQKADEALTNAAAHQVFEPLYKPDPGPDKNPDPDPNHNPDPNPNHNPNPIPNPDQVFEALDPVEASEAREQVP